MPDAKTLMLDNHDDFGGHARRVEFNVSGQDRELFVVYNEERDTVALRFPSLVNRTVIVKINRLFRL